MVILYTSFVRLLRLAQSNRWRDTPESLYHFLSPASLDFVLADARSLRCPLEKLEEVLQTLTIAENDYRVSWRQGNILSSREEARFRRTLEEARGMGADSSRWNLSHLPTAFYNPVFMRELLRNTVRFGDDL